MQWYIFLIGIFFFLFCYIYGNSKNSMPLHIMAGFILIIMAILLYTTGLDIPNGWIIWGL